MPTIEIQSDPNPFHANVVLRGLIAASEARAGVEQHPWPLSIILHDDSGQVAGGAIGKAFWDWLFVDMLWVRDDLRGQGWGSRLLDEAEQLGRARRCTGIWLDTFSFQARPFYEARGYTLFGEIENHPAGHTRYFLKKLL